jgi:type I restriction-modification system DNA methylase subunit
MTRTKKLVAAVVLIMAASSLFAQEKTDAQQRKEWLDRLTKETEYYNKHLPIEIVLSEEVKQVGEVDYKTNKAVFAFEILVKSNDEAFNAIKKLLQNLPQQKGLLHGTYMDGRCAYSIKTINHSGHLWQ